MNTLVYDSVTGVFIKELIQMLETAEIEPRFFSLFGEQVDDLIESIKSAL